jgi:hypothetical protein
VLDKAQTAGTKPRASLDEYIGEYIGLYGLFKLVISQSANGSDHPLEVLVRDLGHRHVLLYIIRGVLLVTTF